jgi:hypothetical protein
VATYRSNGQGLFCNSTFDSGQDGIITGNTRVFSILTTTGLPTEITGGYLRLGNITPSNAFPVQQFFNCEWFPVNPSPLTLYVDNCVTNETSAFVVWANSASGLLSRFTSITFANNTLSGNHGGTPIGCKGMFAVDSSGANTQPWGSTTFYASGNVIGNTTFITAPAPWQTIMDTAAPPGYNAAELALAGWDGTYFVGTPALQFQMELVPADPANAITGWRNTSGRLRLDVCSCDGGDAGVLSFGLSAKSYVDIDQSRFLNFGLLGIGCDRCDLAVTGGTVLQAPAVENTTLWGIICRQDGQLPVPTTALINARITLPGQPQAGTAIGIDLEVDSGQITASYIAAENGIVSGNATGRGVAIGFNNVISQPGQQISSQIVDEVAHNILST